MSRPGTFILSLDAEIAWGTYNSRRLQQHAPTFNRYRELVGQILALLERHGVAATWAVVGHLMLRPGEEPDHHPRPTYSFADASDSQRAPDPERPAWYYGPDLVEAICSSAVPHEVGTHTFTHLLATDPAVDRQLWRADLAIARRLHRERGLPMESLVFPQNRVAWLDSLPEFGIRAFRGTERCWYDRARGALRRLLHLLDRTLALPPPTYAAEQCLTPRGLVNLPASQFLLPLGGVRSLIPAASRIVQARRGLDLAARRGHIYHLWCHPFNLGSGPVMLEVLSAILEHAAELRRQGRLRIQTMAAASSLLSAP